MAHYAPELPLKLGIAGILVMSGAYTYFGWLFQILHSSIVSQLEELSRLWRPLGRTRRSFGKSTALYMHGLSVVSDGVQR